jgi:hypothetical protein
MRYWRLAILANGKVQAESWSWWRPIWWPLEFYNGKNSYSMTFASAQEAWAHIDRVYGPGPKVVSYDPDPKGRQL